MTKGTVMTMLMLLVGAELVSQGSAQLGQAQLHQKQKRGINPPGVPGQVSSFLQNNDIQQIEEDNFNNEGEFALYRIKRQYMYKDDTYSFEDDDVDDDDDSPYKGD